MVQGMAVRFQQFAGLTQRAAEGFTVADGGKI
jgi:hypothetical protein